MAQRVNYFKLLPEAVGMMREIEKYTRESDIDRMTQELVKIRASQINGCAFCINMHTKEAREIGETEQRLYGISAWRDCTFYTDKEKVALELAEQLTLISKNHISDDLFRRVRDHYSEKEFLDLVVLVNQINSWNRLSIAAGNMAT